MRRIAVRALTAGALALAMLALVGCRAMSLPVSPRKKIVLWNGRDLDGWKLVADGEGADVYKVWWIQEGVIHCKGKPNGYMRTRRIYRNYHLHLEWRWPDEPTNSGVLLHSSGSDKVWPRTIECQLKSGSAGDFVLINGTGITVDGRSRQDPAKQYVVIPKKGPGSEEPAGEWNTYDIICGCSAIRCYVNGVLENEGIAASDTAGWICLQSEGGPIEFRNIYIEPPSRFVVPAP